MVGSRTRSQAKSPPVKRRRPKLTELDGDDNVRVHRLGVVSNLASLSDPVMANHDGDIISREIP
jgi:hypothetical protein